MPLIEHFIGMELAKFILNLFPLPLVEISARDVLLDRIQSLAPPFPEFNPEFERAIRFTAAISRAHLIGPILGRINTDLNPFDSFRSTLEYITSFRTRY